MASKSVAIDIDGVIADYSMGWQGDDFIGDPLPGAREFLQSLREDGYKVILHSCRSTKRLVEYCFKHMLPYDYINENPELVSPNPGKPAATVYLDDRGLCFEGDFDQALKAIYTFVPWHKRGNLE